MDYRKKEIKAETKKVKALDEVIKVLENFNNKFLDQKEQPIYPCEYLSEVKRKLIDSKKKYEERIKEKEYERKNYTTVKLHDGKVKHFFRK